MECRRAAVIARPWQPRLCTRIIADSPPPMPMPTLSPFKSTGESRIMRSYGVPACDAILQLPLLVRRRASRCCAPPAAPDKSESATDSRTAAAAAGLRARPGAGAAGDHPSSAATDTVEEYRIGGKLYMIKVTPPGGRAVLPDRRTRRRQLGAQETLDSGIRPPMWVIIPGSCNARRTAAGSRAKSAAASLARSRSCLRCHCSLLTAHRLRSADVRFHHCHP